MGPARRGWLLVGTVAVLVALYWFSEPGKRSTRAGRPPGSSMPRPTASSGDGAPDSPKTTAETTAPRRQPQDDAGESSRPWKPASVTLPGWGKFLVEIVGVEGGAVADPKRPKRLRLMALSARSPHLAIRFRPADGTDYDNSRVDEFEGQLAIQIAGNKALSIARGGRPTVQQVPGSDGVVSVQSIPLTIRGIDKWRADPATSRSSIKIRVKPKLVEGFKGGYAWKDVVLLKPLGRPTIGPGTTSDIEPVARYRESEFADAGVHLYGVVGLSGARVRLRSDSGVLPATLVRSRLTMDGKSISTPTNQVLDDARLSITVRVTPGWYHQRQGLVVAFDVWDYAGNLHSLEWTPELD